MSDSIAPPSDTEAYLTLDELHPIVDLAAYYEAKETMWHKYRVPCQHFLLIIEGEIEAITPHDTYVARPGDLLAFRAAELNQYGTHGPVVFYEAHIQLALPPRHRSTLWLNEVGPLPVLTSLGSSFDRVRQQFDTFCLDLPFSDAERRCRVNAAVWQMLALVSGVVKKTPGQEHALDQWQRARLKLSSHLNEPLEVQHLAKAMGLSPDHFIRRFKQRFGISPKAFRTQARLRHAAHRLRAGNCSVKELAFELGFEDAYSFTRAFKKYLGVLPSDILAGKAPAPPENARMDDTLLKVNRHVLPPHADAEWYRKFTPAT